MTADDAVVCCPWCLSTDPNMVGVEKATGKVCRNQYHCPTPDAHGDRGGPFRFCPYCDWREDDTKEPPGGWGRRPGGVLVTVPPPPAVPGELIEDRSWTENARRVALFWAKVDKRRDDECWPWLAPLTVHGYGRFHIARHRTIQAHRAAYELLIGPIPEGMALDHICHDPAQCKLGRACPHRACVNPRHLEPVTLGENTLRGGGITAELARMTHCRKGHAFDGRNSRGDRFCKACNRATIHERRRALRRQEVLVK